MSRVAPLVPAESDILCESCGYTLNGLPDGANCPECGNPVTSSLGERRRPPAWESGEPGGKLRSFLATSAHVIFRPTRFYRTSTTRGDAARAATFGRWHGLIASALFALTACVHLSLFRPTNVKPRAADGLLFLGLFALAYGGLGLTTWAATRLTAWEAAYRGLRLPLPVVTRGMAYHAAHYLPVALAALATTTGYAVLLRWLQVVSYDTLTKYLYTLCAEVIVAAAYLFHTYWIGMRNMMYANR